MARSKRGGKRQRLKSVYQSSRTPQTVQHTRSGRVIKQRTLLNGTSVTSSAILSDDSYDSDDDVESTTDGDEIRVRRRKLSATPESVEPYKSDMVTDLTDTESIGVGESADPGVAVRAGRLILGESSIAARSSSSSIRINLVVPGGPKRQISLDIDPGSVIPPKKESSSATDATFTLVKLQTTPKVAEQWTSVKNAGSIGLLPPELRTIIYKALFLYQGYLDIGRTAGRHISGVAFLATCRLVYEEGRVILYRENTFRFGRRREHVGLLWSNGQRELGFISFQTFTKIIGPINLGLIRALRLDLEDVRSTLTLQWNMNERRFVSDEILLSGLRELVRHARLAAIRISFDGMRSLDNQPMNYRFLGILTQIKADEVVIQDVWGKGYSPNPTKDVKDLCLEAMTRKRKLYKRHYEIAEWLPPWDF